MSLKLMYITNKPNIAKLAQDSGVDRIWIDLEYIGKEERQKGLDTVKSKHKISDILLIKPILNKSQLLVRINPIHENTKREIEDVISNGADIIMLPMFRTKDEVYKFLKIVNGRVKTSLLVETKDAVNNIDEILNFKGIDEIHIGLNDLHLEYKKTFMFEMLIDEIVKNLCLKCREYGIPYGIGGIARIGLGSV
ncbi:aldolase/citrate lyase family protein, partial [Cetobacterium sp.]